MAIIQQVYLPLDAVKEHLEEVATTATSPMHFEAGIAVTLSSAAGPISRRAMRQLQSHDVTPPLLCGNVRKCAINQHGSRVLIQLAADASRIGWIADELIGAGASVACQRFGCRVLASLIRTHFAEKELDITADVLLDECIEEAACLAESQHGSRVLCSLLEHGTDKVRSSIVAALLPDLVDHSLDRFGSQVVAAALKHGGRESRQSMVRELLEAHLAVLAEGPEGCRVLRSLLLSLRRRDPALAQLEEAEAALWSTRYGRKLIKDFDIVDMDDA